MPQEDKRKVEQVEVHIRSLELLSFEEEAEAARVLHI